jgi:branched-chain amino acid transport system permease protein
VGDFLSNLPQYLANGLVAGCYYALVAMGFNVIYSSTGVINFAQGEFYMFGALLTYTFSSKLGLPVALAAMAAVAATALIGACMERVVIFPLRRAPVINMIIGTIGASILFKAVGRVFWPEDVYRVPGFIEGSFRFLKFNLDRQDLLVLAITALSIFLVWFFFQRTRAGKAMKACSINRQAAGLVGVNVSRMSMYAFAMSAALAALAGLLDASYVNYGIGLTMGISGFTAAVLGGLGSTFGAVAGGFLLGVVMSVTAGFLQVVLNVSSGYTEAIIPALLILVLLLRPQGIMGAGEKVRV